MATKKRKHTIYKPVPSNMKETIIRSVYESPSLIDIKTKDKETEKGDGTIKGDKIKKGGKRKYIINKLNHINFKDGTILINFQHKKYSRTISRHVKPQPCQNDRLDCLWAETAGLHPIIKSYTVKNLLINDGNRLLLIRPEVISFNRKGISFKLPDTYKEVRNRRVKRHTCKGITAKLFQNSVMLSGSLLDFSAVAFRIGVVSEDPHMFQWVNTETSVNIILSDENDVLYSGECRILKEIKSPQVRNYVLEPVNYQIQRFKRIEYRSKRQKLVPSPNMVFTHPLTGKLIDLKIIDISGSGFSVEEDEDSALLLPGMVIPELDINFANSTRIRCKTQVVYRTTLGEGDKGRVVKCGLAILDVDLKDHMQLLAILNQAEDKDLYICNNVDMDELWDFFFETGLIHSRQYNIVQANKEHIKKTYEKLYTKHPNVARHFIYQDKGSILGHTTLLRYYENTWMLQNNASRSSSIKARLALMKQVAGFICDSYRLSSIHMNYLINYFSPNNKFSNIIYRGAERNINNPYGCTLDTFAYFHYQRKINDKMVISKPWSLTKTVPEDLKELENYYSNASGGLMIQALDLQAGSIDGINLSKEYKALGFKRGRFLLSLKKYDTLKAIVVLDISDVCLNFYDLTNSIKIITLDPDDLPKSTLFLMLSLLCKKIMQNEMPVLIYPVEYATEQSIPFDKLFNLWVLNAQYSDQFFKHIKLLMDR